MATCYALGMTNEELTRELAKAHSERDQLAEMVVDLREQNASLRAAREAALEALRRVHAYAADRNALGLSNLVTYVFEALGEED